jgi:DNA-binding protein HU-beta
MTKLELISIVAKKTGLTNNEVSKVIECLFETIMTSMSEGHNISARKFGTFLNKIRAKKLARNIKTNTTMMLDECCVPTFKPSEEFVAMIKQKVKPSMIRAKKLGTS